MFKNIFCFQEFVSYEDVYSYHLPYIFAIKPSRNGKLTLQYKFPIEQTTPFYNTELYGREK